MCLNQATLLLLVLRAGTLTGALDARFIATFGSWIALFLKERGDMPNLFLKAVEKFAWVEYPKSDEM